MAEKDSARARKGRAGGPRRGAAGGSRSQGPTACEYRAEFAGQVEKLCRLGASAEELADFFGVEVEGVEAWKAEHGEFGEAVRRGRLLADAEVADRLYLRARGYTHEAVKIMQRMGEPVIVPYEEHYPPDTTACIFWLKNRRPDLWRDKVLDAAGEKKGSAMELTVAPEALAAIREAAGHAAKVEAPAGRRGSVPGDSGDAGEVPGDR